MIRCAWIVYSKNDLNSSEISKQGKEVDSLDDGGGVGEEGKEGRRTRKGEEERAVNAAVLDIAWAARAFRQSRHAQ